MIDTEENEYSRDTPSLEIEDREKFMEKDQNLKKMMKMKVIVKMMMMKMK